MITVNVKASKTYDVIIGKGLIGCAVEKIREVAPSSRLCVVTDKKVASLYLDRVMELLQKGGIYSELYRLYSTL